MIAGLVAGLFSVVPVIDGADYLAKASANENQVLAGAFFQLLMVAAYVGVPVLMYPILSKPNKGLAQPGGPKRCTRLRDMLWKAGVPAMNKSERFWDQTASRYDQLEKKDEPTYAKMINKTKTHLRASDIVLDCGCGTGRISNEIAGYVKGIQAIDISSNMIKIAENKAKERNIANITYAHTTIFDERYKKGSFDVILAFHVLHLSEDEHIVLQRMHELLKPGGLWISATPCVGEKIFLRSLLFLAGQIGLVPKIRSFKIRHFIHAIERGNFSVVESDSLKKRSREYFIVARKI